MSKRSFKLELQGDKGEKRGVQLHMSRNIVLFDRVQNLLDPIEFLVRVLVAEQLPEWQTRGRRLPVVPRALSAHVVGQVRDWDHFMDVLLRLEKNLLLRLVRDPREN